MDSGFIVEKLSFYSLSLKENKKLFPNFRRASHCHLQGNEGHVHFNVTFTICHNDVAGSPHTYVDMSLFYADATSLFYVAGRWQVGRIIICHSQRHGNAAGSPHIYVATTSHFYIITTPGVTLLQPSDNVEKFAGYKVKLPRYMGN